MAAAPGIWPPGCCTYRKHSFTLKVALATIIVWSTALFEREETRAQCERDRPKIDLCRQSTQVQRADKKLTQTGATRASVENVCRSRSDAEVQSANLAKILRQPKIFMHPFAPAA